MAEHRIVVPVVGGSSPLIHPEVERSPDGAIGVSWFLSSGRGKVRPRPGTARRSAPGIETPSRAEARFGEFRFNVVIL